MSSSAATSRVGTAGSGKSSVVNLLPRFYDVSAGAVRIGGVDVRDLETRGLRSALGVVFEDSFLFSDSVRSNIAFGRSDATDDEVRAAASQQSDDPLAFLRIRRFFGDLVDDPRFTAEYTAALGSFHSIGARATLAAVTGAFA